jgi:hypothetical protein
MFQFEKIPSETDITYYCDFGKHKFNLCGYIISGVTKISLFYWTKGNVGINLYSIRCFRLGKFEVRELAEMFLNLCIESFNKSIIEQVEKEYLPGGQHYIESEKKIRELEN